MSAAAVVGRRIFYFFSLVVINLPRDAVEDALFLLATALPPPPVPRPAPAGAAVATVARVAKF